MYFVGNVLRKWKKSVIFEWILGGVIEATKNVRMKINESIRSYRSVFPSRILGSIIFMRQCSEKLDCLNGFWAGLRIIEAFKKLFPLRVLNGKCPLSAIFWFIDILKNRYIWKNLEQEWKYPKLQVSFLFKNFWIKNILKSWKKSTVLYQFQNLIRVSEAMRKNWN